MAEEIFLSVVIPAHNEEHRLPSTLSRLQEFLPTQGYTFEVIIVENGSRDGTRAVVERARPGFAQLRLLSVPRAGKGGAGGAQEVFSRQVLQGWTFDVEDLFLARRLGYSVVDVPIPWTYQAESRVQVAADSLRMLADLVRIRVNWMRGVYDTSRPSPPQSAL